MSSVADTINSMKSKFNASAAAGLDLVFGFNITDEGEGLSEKGGRRLRSWDNCMSSLFTREASGHNPRMLKAFRMRNRVSHKYSTYPENWGAFSCSGCGRCISNCPVCVDIRAIVLAAIEDGNDDKKSTDK